MSTQQGKHRGESYLTWVPGCILIYISLSSQGLLQSAGINESDLNQLGNILRDLGSSLG